MSTLKHNDYYNPPIHELVLGVQFSAPKGYSSCDNSKVWELYKAEYPLLQEVPPLEQQYEIFGRRQQKEHSIMFNVGVPHHRLWFKSLDECSLIQFQKDRLLHNWRKLDHTEVEYPRYSRVSHDFFKEITLLEELFDRNWKQSLEINQCEMTYINHIDVPLEASVWETLVKWIEPFSNLKIEYDEIQLSMSKVIKDIEDAPYARLNTDISIDDIGEDKIRIFLNLTMRGKPKTYYLEDVKYFFEEAHALLSNQFEKITTRFAKESWGYYK